MFTSRFWRFASVWCFSIALAWTAVCTVSAADSRQLDAAFQHLISPKLDLGRIFRIDTLTIEHRDFALHLSGGYLIFLRPIIVDTNTLEYGALYVGDARFQYQPPLLMEREQIRRFLKTDTLNRHCPNALLLFNKPIYDRLAGLSTKATPGAKDKPERVLDERFSSLTIKEDYGVPFALFKNLITHRSKPFLAVCVPGDWASDLVYMYDPYRQEEISLYKKYREAIVDLFLETICQYSVYADSTFERLNGIDKDEIRIHHYDLAGAINGGGRYTGKATISLTAEMVNTQLLALDLHPKLRVDSVRDAAGRAVSFVRWTKEKNRSEPLYLMLNEPLALEDTTTLTFYYHGDIAESKVGVFLVNAASSWYPSYSYRSAATFDMTFDSPPQYAFVATGHKVDSQAVDGVMRTRWRITTPTAFATFNLGTLSYYPFQVDSGRSVDVYFNEHQHKAMAIHNVYRPTTLEQPDDTTGGMSDENETSDSKAVSVDPSMYAEGMGVAGSHMEHQVANDVIGATKLFSSLFGDIPDSHLVATDLTQLTSYAYPGFVALSYATFFKTDQFGGEQMHRAHEVAHQWYGVGVGWSTYHDQWLSEGVAEYCSMIYLQRAQGNGQMLYWLNQYRKDVASLNKYLIKDRQQAGPIALGYRTSTTQSEGDADLIVYEKGAYVLHMLRGMMLDLNTYSDSSFYSMLREFHTLYRGRFATTRDFKSLAEKYTRMDLTWFFNQWVYGNTIPSYEFGYTVSRDSSGEYFAHCRVEQKEVAPDFKMPVPIEIQFTAGGSAWVRQWIDKPVTEFTIGPIEGEPSKLIFNPMYFVLADVKQ